MSCVSTYLLNGSDKSSKVRQEVPIEALDLVTFNLCKTSQRYGSVSEEVLTIISFCLLIYPYAYVCKPDNA